MEAQRKKDPVRPMLTGFSTASRFGTDSDRSISEIAVSVLNPGDENLNVKKYISRFPIKPYSYLFSSQHNCP